MQYVDDKDRIEKKASIFVFIAIDLKQVVGKGKQIEFVNVLLTNPKKQLFYTNHQEKKKRHIQ